MEISATHWRLIYLVNRESFILKKLAADKQILLSNLDKFKIHCPPKVKVQHVLMLSCFAHYSWINEQWQNGNKNAL